MFLSKSLLSLVLISLASVPVGANPLGSRTTGKASLNFATKINVSGSLNIAEKDRARAQALKNAGHLGKRGWPVSATNGAVAYTTQVGVGSPPTYYTLLVDTGSSNTWVGANQTYVKTSTSHDTGNTVSVFYGSGFFFGEEYTDTVTIAPGLIITDQSIGVASSAYGFSNLDGILGVGPVDLTQDTVSNTNTVPTVTDNLLSQGTISEEVLGIFYMPASELGSTGILTFGGVDDFVSTSSVEYVPLTTTSPASTFWGINESISYGSTTILFTTAGIVDTGTTLILIATNAFNLYQSATGGTLDYNTGLLTITSSQYDNLQTLSFNIGGTSYDLSPNAQIWPRSLNSAIGGISGTIYLVVADIGSDSGSGLDFVNGYTFLERFYSVFDTANSRVGFAPTYYTSATTN